jgi:hypothetical protein
MEKRFTKIVFFDDVDKYAALLLACIIIIVTFNVAE